MRTKNKIDRRHIWAVDIWRQMHQTSPNIIDLADSCSPQELEYTAGWRDRMSGTKRTCAGRHESAYKLGWRDADWNILRG